MDLGKSIGLALVLPFFITCTRIGQALERESSRPDMVIFISDDHTWRDSSVYGSPDISTPNMKRLAAAGMTLNNAFVASPSCAPSRAALLTGMYPASNGAEPNHSRPRAELKKLPAYLQKLGYEVVSFGKVGHYRQTPEYGFDIARHFTYHDDVAVEEAIKWLRARRSEQPLCLFVGTNWPHVPWPEEAPGIAADRLAVPPHHVDSPVSRQWRARYVAAIGTMDRELGAVYDAAREVLGNDVFFLHTSDHGAQWPFSKWTLYEDGIRTPMIVSWPGRIASGRRSDALVSWIDILPTLLEVAGGAAPQEIDGRSFLPVLADTTTTHRDVIFTTHSGDGNFNVFPMRSARTADGWKYIRNLHPEFRFGSHVTKSVADNGYWTSWLDAATRDEKAKRLVLRYQNRPAEELYDTRSDPYEQRNLIAAPDQQRRVAALRGRLDRWLDETRDAQAVFGEPQLAPTGQHPNVIMVLIDDLGWTDLSCYGGAGTTTKNIDRLASEGLRFTNYYVASPVCSPSRVALSTGQYPQRHRITSHLGSRRRNRERGIAQWLDKDVPMLARELQRVGYATGHFGKWHLGGQRDVGNAPLIRAYGFDRSLTNFEGLGPRVLPLKDAYDGAPPQQHDLGSAALGKGPVRWEDRSQVTASFVDEALQFIDQSQATEQPFFVNIWPDDVHSPHFPPKVLREKTDGSKRQLYQAVLDALDQQLGRLFDRVWDDPQLRDNTLILVMSDNGPEAGCGASDPLRHGKGWLYEGGLRSPLVVWAPGFLAADKVGKVNDSSVLCAMDVNRSLYSFAGVPAERVGPLDGEDVLQTILGRSTSSRSAPIFWRRPPDHPGRANDDNPDLAVRDGRWKYLVNYDGSQPQLYDLVADPSESSNLVDRQPKDAARLHRALLDWNGQLPRDAGDPQWQGHTKLGSAGTSPDAVDRGARPFQSELITQWGATVTAENAWTEYPRPQMQRDNWINLNGLWEYAITPIKEKNHPSDWTGTILVPYCLESRLGGARRLLDPNEALWYRRTFDAKPTDGRRLLLNFEAVDYRCEVFVNGQRVGTHVGGHTPFSLDVSGAIQAGQNELLVRVEDATEAWQLRGKQVLGPRGIWYTRVSGIWQTVWLEEVPGSHIRDVKIATDAASGTITVRPLVSNGERIRVLVRDGEELVGDQTGADTISLQITRPKLWSPASPHLYAIEIQLLGSGGELLDRVTSYTGIRSVGKALDADGNWRFTLNGQPIFHWGPLDQGWWPDGLLTPPSDEAMLFDIEWLKSAGFNMIRKHIKVEPRRYYYHCDRLGMMVWQDQVSGGVRDNGGWPAWTRLSPDPADAQWPAEQHQQFMAELEAMIGCLESHPSIVCWVPFNEAWGQHQTVEVGRWTARRDPSRLVNIASGGNFWPVGDIVDEHRYPHPGFPFDLGKGGRFDGYIKVMGEFGGHGYPVPGHLWDATRRNWGYGDLPKSEAEYKQRYVTSLNLLNELRGKGIAAGVYTQTTDVEGEVNGLMTYDRKVIKIPAKELAELHRVLFSESPPGDTGTSQFPQSALQEVPTDRKPGPVMDAPTIRAGLKSHDRALYIKAGWIRDPYITLGPDDWYYLTGTQASEGDLRELTNPYNIGLGERSIVGDQVRVWRSKDLIAWESLGNVFGVGDTVKAMRGEPIWKRLIWAPEVHWLGDRWALVHCPKAHSSLALTAGRELKGPWTHPMKGNLGRRHDPSLFTDDDGTRYLLWGNTFVAPLNPELTDYAADPVRIDPSGSRPGPEGRPIRRIGHEGATMIKVGGKYVHLGTAWSTDQGRRGSYNLYYCVADAIGGPYGPRKFAGRFLGHGTPFRDRDGQWWCTAFFNANLPPLPREGITRRDLRENAQTINEQGVTIVPLDVRVLETGDVHIRAKDPAYGTPGPDEAQRF